MAARFAYYDRLSKKDKAIYRKSDDAPSFVLPEVATLRPLAQAVSEALAKEKRVAVAKASTALSDALCDQLGAPRVKLHVRETRPAIGEGAELHGLYTYADEEEGTPPRIEVWMRTHALGKVVRFRTFLRTLVHELGHHFDLTLLDLADSFHTAGFYRRESSLVRQLLDLPPQPRRPRADAKAEAKPQPKRPSQLTLF